jgi:nucleobase transporter 1/2
MVKAVPKWMQSKGSSAIDTGSKDIDSLLTVLLSTSMFVGGFIAFVLDNTVSG